MVLRHEVLRAYLTTKLAHGERKVLTRAYFSDGTIEEQTNPGLPDPDELPWKQVGRFTDLESERARLLGEGWSFENP